MKKHNNEENQGEIVNLDTDSAEETYVHDTYDPFI